jgi:hypothetical protein
MGLLTDQQREQLDNFSDWAGAFGAAMTKRSAPGPTPKGGLLGNVGVALNAADQAMAKRERQELQRQAERFRMQQAKAEAQQAEQQRQAVQKLINPQQTRGPRNAREAILPGPGGMASGGRAGPSQSQIESARAVQRRGGLLGDLSEQERGLLAAYPEQAAGYLAKAAFSQPEPQDNYQIVRNEQGQPIGQRNTRTGEISGLPDSFNPQRDRLSKNDLLAVQTENGTRLVPADQAVGMQPAQDQGDAPVWQQKRDELAATLQADGFNNPGQLANNIVLGRYSIDRDPVTRRAQVIDKATGNIVGRQGQAGGQSGGQSGGYSFGAPSAMPGTGQPQPSGQQQPSQSGGQASAQSQGGAPLEEATGASQLWKGALNYGVGMLTGDDAMPEETEASTRLDNLRRDSMGVLAKEINSSRPSNFTQQQILKTLPGPMDTDARAREKAQQTVRMLDSRIETAQEIIENETNYAPDTVGRAKSLISDLKRLRQRWTGFMGAGQSGNGQSVQSREDVPRISSEEEYQELPSGTLFLDPEGKLRRKP